LNHWVYRFIVFLFLVGCSDKNPTPITYQYPAWYDKKPSSDLYFYGVGEAEDVKEAKNIALKMIVDEVTSSLDTNKSVPIHFSTVRVVELIEHKRNVVTLVSVEKEALYERNYKDLSIYLRRIEKIDEDGSDEFINRYFELKRRVDDLDNIEERIALLHALKKEFDGSDMRDEYQSYQEKIALLKQAIRVNIRSDFESISLVESIKETFKNENIKLNDKRSTFVSDYRLSVSGECNDENFELQLKLFNFEDKIIASKVYTFTCKDDDEKLLAFEKMASQKDMFLLLGL